MDSGFPQPDVDATPDMVIGAALLTPAFCEDLSTWRIAIHRDGTVLQELRPAYCSEVFESVQLTLRGHVTRERLDEILQLARDIGFDDFAASYDTQDITDQQNTSITLNDRGQAKRVTAYAAGYLRQQGNEALAGYCRLWQMLEEIAPYQGLTVKQRREMNSRSLKSLATALQAAANKKLAECELTREGVGPDLFAWLTVNYDACLLLASAALRAASEPILNGRHHGRVISLEINQRLDSNGALELVQLQRIDQFPIQPDAPQPTRLDFLPKLGLAGCVFIFILAVALMVSGVLYWTERLQ